MTAADLRALMAAAERQPGETTEQYGARHAADHQLSSWRTWLPGLLDALAPAADTGLMLAAAWHDLRAATTPDVFEQELHEVSSRTIRSMISAIANDPDLGPIGPGHTCKHHVRWPHPCDECDRAVLASLSPIALASQAGTRAPEAIRPTPAGAHSSEVPL